MKRGFVIAVLVLAGCNIPGLDDPTAGGSSSTSSGSGIATFDGTYSYSYQIDNNGTEQSNSNVAQFIISNGVISSNPAGFAGSVSDSTSCGSELLAPDDGTFFVLFVRAALITLAVRFAAAFCLGTELFR